MATAKKTAAGAATQIISLIPEDPAVPRPRLHKLIVKNFRAIGHKPVEIELDEIVVLVGPNNAGKSSILRAYDVAMKQGSSEGKLQIEDFPNGQVTQDALPEIELQTVVFDNAPGERWLAPTAAGEWLIREQWRWASPNDQPKRRGFDVGKGDWDDNVPWGAPAIANSRRPRPHRIEAFSSPDVQTKEIVELLLTVLKDKLKAYRTNGPEQQKSDYENLIDQISEFQKRVVASAAEEMQRMETEISSMLEKVFPKHRIKLDAKPESDVEKAYTPFKASPEVLMGPDGGYLGKVAQQGSGARRTLLWAALKYLTESAAAKDGSARPHVLLLDEPEICLHPNAIREAKEVLYALPETKNWQVMITTHSPIFIDLAKDNTTVVRVERDQDEAIRSVTLHRPSKVQLDENDRQNLKALNACDPYLNEFFFGGDVIVVEGDTEYTAFQLLKSLNAAKYRNIHVIRARGKGAILTVLKILNQFSARYAVLHDSDVPLTKKGGASPAWGANASIREAIEKGSTPGAVIHVVSVPNFEVALFGEEASTDKPYNTLTRLNASEDMRNRAGSLLDALLDAAQPTHAPFRRWTTLQELGAALPVAAGN
ncbi:MAG: AAA family ATPase [Aquabacterium sp.]|uniref:ATP-dependent nuclease n=1 Tax=Aquabacterium sp. TaxID=1872578 RepID=UPI002720FA93|nr:AAA family ATPase [Aquabacterium sp.]MDO9004778.1 AAA family ATPase [Aquabacterium sp.]